MDYPRADFHACLTPDERSLVDRLNTPEAIQAFVAEEVSYNFEPNGATDRRPLEVLRRKQAHCFEGAILAAALFWYHGIDPLLVLLEAPEDFDHNLIIYTMREYYWGLLMDAVFGLKLAKPGTPGWNRSLLLSSLLCTRLDQWGGEWPPIINHG